MQGYSWPTPRIMPDYILKTKPLPRELLHAIGVVIVIWNDIEGVQCGLLRECLGYRLNSSPESFRIGTRIVEPMGNRQRGELLRGAIRELDLPEATSLAIEAFQQRFDICLGNRNLIVHSSYIEEEGFTLISSEKATPHIAYRYMPDDVEFWETTILEMRGVAEFGFNLLDSLSALHSAPALPEIPPMPRDLLKTLELHRV